MPPRNPGTSGVAVVRPQWVASVLGPTARRQLAQHSATRQTAEALERANARLEAELSDLQGRLAQLYAGQRQRQAEDAGAEEERQALEAENAALRAEVAMRGQSLACGRRGRGYVFETEQKALGCGNCPFFSIFLCL